MNAKPKTLAELEKVVQQTSKRVLDLGNWMLDLLGLVQRVSGVMALLQTKQVAMAEEVQQHLKMPHAVPQEGLVETRARCDELRNEVAALSSRLTELESARAGEDARAIADLSERVAAIQENGKPGPAKDKTVGKAPARVRVPPKERPTRPLSLCCASCAFASDEHGGSQERDEETLLSCKRYPASALADASSEDDAIEDPLVFAQPTVFGGDWCGEFKACASEEMNAGTRAKC